MSYLKNMECWRLHPWSLRSAAKLSPPTAPLVTRLPGRGPRAGGSYPGTELCHVFCRARVTSLNPSSASHPFGCRHTARDSVWSLCSGKRTNRKFSQMRNGNNECEWRRQERWIYMKILKEGKQIYLATLEIIKKSYNSVVFLLLN